VVLRLWTPERRNPQPAPELDDTALAARRLGGKQHGWKLVYVLAARKQSRRCACWKVCGAFCRN
jgi:hypothetical protein